MINFVSLGKSCQTTHQIAHFAETYPHKAGMIKSPFDWLVCPPDSAAQWLNEGLQDFDPQHIVEHRGRAWWPQLRLWFWHGFIDHSVEPRVLDLHGLAEHELSRLSHLRDKFRSLDVSSTVFVVSNTQNNLATEVFEDGEEERYWFTQGRMDSLQSALDSYFGKPSRLQIVTREDRADAGLLQKPNVYSLPRDDSNWKGNKNAWGELLMSLANGEEKQGQC